MGACRGEVWRRGGAQGLLGINLPEAYGGGAGLNDFRYSVMFAEECNRLA